MGINDDIPVNDGSGLWDNAGLCDTLISDCNNALKQLTSGQYIVFCGIMYQIVLKLSNLKKGIQEETKSKNETIEELKRMNNELSAKDGVVNGSN